MNRRRDVPLLGLAAAAAFAASLLAIAQHSENTAFGYRLAASQAEGEALAREAARLERRVASLRSPVAVLARRGAAMKSLADLDHQSKVPPLPTGSAIPGPSASAASAAAQGRRP